MRTRSWTAPEMSAQGEAVRVYVPSDTTAKSLGADGVATQIEQAAAQRAQLLDPVRVREEAHVEDEVGVARDAVLVAEGDEAHLAEIDADDLRADRVDGGDAERLPEGGAV